MRRSDDRAGSLGPLPRGRIARDGLLYAGLLHAIRKQVGAAAVGKTNALTDQDGRCRTLVARRGNSKWDQGQAQVRYVESVLTRGALGVYFSQPHLIRDAGGRGREARSQRRSTRERKTTKGADGFVAGATQ